MPPPPLVSTKEGGGGVLKKNGTCAAKETQNQLRSEPDEGLMVFYGRLEVQMLKQVPNTDITEDG